jgi:hypothetical protein
MARSGSWGSFKVRRERPRRARNLSNTHARQSPPRTGICQQRANGLRISPTIRRARAREPQPAWVRAPSCPPPPVDQASSTGMEKKMPRRRRHRMRYPAQGHSLATRSTDRRRRAGGSEQQSRRGCTITRQTKIKRGAPAMPVDTDEANHRAEKGFALY